MGGGLAACSPRHAGKGSTGTGNHTHSGLGRKGPLQVICPNVGAAQPSEADLETGKPMVLARPAALVTWLKVCGDALWLEGEDMSKQEGGSAHQIPASAHPLQTLTIWPGPGLTDFWPSSEG